MANARFFFSHPGRSNGRDHSMISWKYASPKAHDVEKVGIIGNLSKFS